MMKPFILTQHEKDSYLVRELTKRETSAISGGDCSPEDKDTIDLGTVTCNPDGCIDDGCDN